MTQPRKQAPSKPLRRRRTFIGCDPVYTGTEATTGAARTAEPEAAAGPAQPEMAVDVPEAPIVRVLAKPTPAPAAARKSPSSRTALASQPRPRRDIVLRLRIGPDASAQLEALSRSVGQPTPVLLKHVRKAVVAEFRTLLDGAERPASTATHRTGLPDTLSIRLADHERDRARAWFDPLGLGNTAMADFARPVLTKLYEDTIRQLAEQ